MLIPLRLKHFALLYALSAFASGDCLWGDTLLADERRGESVDAVETREVIVEKVVTEAVAGEPLGAGRIELVYVAGHGPVIYPDQRLVLASTDRRVATRPLRWNINNPTPIRPIR